jgi:hypothetical protein
VTEPDESLDDDAQAANRRELRTVAIITIIALLVVLVGSLLIVASGLRP